MNTTRQKMKRLHRWRFERAGEDEHKRQKSESTTPRSVAFQSETQLGNFPSLDANSQVLPKQEHCTDPIEYMID